MINLVGDKAKRIEEEMHELAIRAIKDLEYQMLDEFGIRFEIGIEVEGWAVGTIEGDLKPLLDEKEIFSLLNHRIIERFYQEEGGDYKSTKYEFATTALSPATAALAVIKIREIAAQRAAKHNIKDFSFLPFRGDVCDEIKTAGMHVNISLWKEGEPLFCFNDVYSIFNDFILHASNKEALQVQRDAFFCIAMSGPSLERLSSENEYSPNFVGSKAQESFSPEKTFILRHSKKLSYGGDRLPSDKIRIENMLPGADADPYLAVLTTMASIYAGVKSKIKQGRGGELEIPKRMPPFPSLAKFRFPESGIEGLRDLVAEDNRFTALLNRITAGLGTKLVEKIEEYAAARYHVFIPEHQGTGVAR